FGDVPVLTKPAAEIASRRAERKHARSGQKMVQRFLFNRIDTKSAAPAIRGQYHPIAHPLPDETESALSFIEFAKSRTEPALDTPVRQRLPPTRRIIGLRQLCDHWPAISIRKSGTQEKKNGQIETSEHVQISLIFADYLL